MAPQLPIELHEDISDLVSRIELSEHSRKALRQCSLTCRAWVPLVQRHLFRSYTLSRRSACPPFLEVLEKSTTGLAEHIRKLYLKTGVFDDNGIPSPATRRIIQCLVNLQTLHILTTVWPTREAISRITASEGLPLSTDAARLIGAPNLSTLRLRSVSFDSATDLVHLLAACPRLVALRFSGLRFAQGRSSSMESANFPSTPCWWNAKAKMKMTCQLGSRHNSSVLLSIYICGISNGRIPAPSLMAYISCWRFYGRLRTA